MRQKKPSTTWTINMAQSRPRMPYFAVPRYIEYVKEIPKTPTQKIQKNKLRDRGLTETAWDREAAGYKVRR